LPPDLPTLLNIIANGFTNEANFTTTEHTFVIDRNEVIELVIHGSPNGAFKLYSDFYILDEMLIALSAGHIQYVVQHFLRPFQLLIILSHVTKIKSIPVSMRAPFSIEYH
jgi:hypothetical protein